MSSEPPSQPKSDISIAGDADTIQTVHVSGGHVGNVISRATIFSGITTRDWLALILATLTFLMGFWVAQLTRPQAAAALAQREPPIGVANNPALGCLPSDIKDVLPAPSFVGAYPADVRLAMTFDQVDSVRVFDTSSHRMHGWLRGSFGLDGEQREGYDGTGGLYFDGASLVCIPDQAALALRQKIEISVWVRPALIDNKTRNVVTKFKPDLQGSSYRLYLRNGYPVFWLGGPTGVTVESPYQLHAGQWSHLVVRYDGARLQLFVDDKEAAIDHRGSIPVTTAWLEIGSTSYRNEFFLGSIDELIIRGE